MTDSRSIQSIIIVIVVAVMAAWLGVAVVTDQMETLIKVGGAGLLITCVLLGKRVWLAMIFLSAMQVPLIRGFGTDQLGQVLFIGFSLMLIAIRRLHLQFKVTELEVWIMLVGVMIAQAYLRNPVGLNMFGGSTVGAKPYFVAGLAFCSGWLLSWIKLPASELRWAMRLTLLGTFVGLPISFIRHRFGGGEVGEMGSISMVNQAGGSTRIPLFARLAEILSRLVVSYISPIRAVLSPKWGLVLVVSLGIAAASGYRNAVATVGLTYMLGVIYRSGFGAALLSTIAGSILLGALALYNIAAPLPGNIQRALSPLPGSWEERHVKDAENSTEWRVEMWKAALLTDDWIRNKYLGDGLGMTAEELRRLQSLSAGGRDSWTGAGGLTIQQENMMLTGGYHSGPVQTIRTVGYVGLAVFLFAMVRLAVHAHRQIRRCRGTEWEPVAYFFGIPLLVLPIFFTFVFGEFSQAASLVFLGFAMVRLMERNLPLPEWKKAVPEPWVPLSRRNAIGASNPG
ncbi:hypothetical protein OKA04_10595 [Luteolibacter flavescens]|uniref:O-antigen ligase domain-containing protein n=1 Tax=Luteolibacter flavescens TaxID=1859460 RepID=A0ABT3FNM1_9BACT|nr:hypothetical protein [Luteolibacter flavescens]MCW1885176.1 hypothetical protein [Luteolibacter flavescens]